MVMAKTLEASLVLAAASVALAVKLWSPSDSTAEVKVKVPGFWLSSVAKPTELPSRNTSTVEPASAVMVSVGVVSLVK